MRCSVLAPLALIAGSSCMLPQAGPEPPPSTAFGTGVSELEVQALVMQMADDHNAALGEAVYLLMEEGDVVGRERWLPVSFLRNGMGAALDIAAGPNPDVALLDLLVVTELQAWALATHWIPNGIPSEGGQAAIARLRAAQDGMWQSARRVLDEEQEALLRELIAGWIEEHPDQMVVSFVRFDEFTKEREVSTTSTRGQARGLLRDVGEASAAVEDARLFGERVVWFASRYPYVLGQQAELTLYRMADQPEVRRILSTLDLAASAAESLTHLEALGDDLSARLDDYGAELPAVLERLAEERTRTIEEASAALEDRIAAAIDLATERFEVARAAAFDDAFGRIAAEREAVTAEVRAAVEALEETLPESRTTAEAAAEAGRTLTEAAIVAERVLVLLRSREGEERRPFEIVEAAAVELQAAAEAGDVTLARLESVLESADLPGALASAEQSAKQLLDGLFLRGLALVGLLVAGLVLVRRIPQRGQ